MLKLIGKDAEIILKLLRGEKPDFSSKNYRESLKRLEEKGLVKERKLTSEGTDEAEWRKNIIDRTQDVYDLKVGGDYIREIHFAYEPVTAYSYAWNWAGQQGVSTIKEDPKRKEYYFEALDKKFWLGEKKLDGEELSFNMPDPKIVEAWSKGNIISLESAELWTICNNYFHFFLDFKEPAFYHMLCLAAFQSWLLIDETMFNSCFFIVVKGAFGGGKSVSCEAVIYISCHGKVASPSVAYLGRSIERLRLSIFIDEFDINIDKDAEIGRLARICQRRGQSYDRSTKSGKPQSFKVFGPWIMSVHGEVEDALATRSLPITVQETGEWDIPVANIEKVMLGQQLYTKMWMWYLDSIDHISYKNEIQRNIDFSIDSLLPSLIITEDENGYFVTVTAGEGKRLPKTGEVTRVTPNTVTTNHDRYPRTRVTVDQLRKTVAESILSSCSEKQKNMIKSAAGRNVELMTNCFKIANIIGIQCDQSIKDAFRIKKEVEEEEREIGLTGYLRDFLAKMYEDRRHSENYWTTQGQFMVSNKECTDEFTKFLHKHEQAAVGPGDFKRALRELAFVRPTSRKKMKILTWKEIMDETRKKDVTRLANIYTEKVQKRLGITTKKPDDFGQTELPTGIMYVMQANPAMGLCESCGKKNPVLLTHSFMLEGKRRYCCTTCAEEEEEEKPG